MLPHQFHPVGIALDINMAQLFKLGFTDIHLGLLLFHILFIWTIVVNSLKTTSLDGNWTNPHSRQQLNHAVVNKSFQQYTVNIIEGEPLTHAPFPNHTPVKHQ